MKRASETWWGAANLVAPPASLIQRLVAGALREDIGHGDATTDSLISPSLSAHAEVVFKEDAVVAGLPVLAATFRCLDPECDITCACSDGDVVTAGTSVAVIAGQAAAMLTAERVALNFLQRLSGIATLTSRYVRAIEGTSATIVDTRKTTPGLRALEKYAVRAGGGQNHRYHLADGVLIKDNHLAALNRLGIGLADAVRFARRHAPHTLNIEVEAESLVQVQEALEGGADIILLDNMGIASLKEAVQLVAGKAMTEASGGVRLDTVRAIAETGVDLISVGALTRSAPSVDISLEWAMGDGVME